MSAVQKVWSSYVYATILLQHGPTAEAFGRAFLVIGMDPTGLEFEVGNTKISNFTTKEASTPFPAVAANLARMTWRCHPSAISANVDVGEIAATLPAPTMVRC
jgi:hypothetical protein